MTDSKLESLWKLMSEYTFEVETYSSNVNLTCGICKKLMIDACQTACGCQYCYKCISEHLADGDQYCPGDKEFCEEEELTLDKHVFKNSFLNKRILTAKVRCPNQSCVCIFLLTQMEEHMRVCTKQQTQCPYVQIGCDNEGASKDAIVTHLQNETFTHSQLLIELIYNLKNELDGLKYEFEKSQLEISSLREQLTLKDEQMREIILQVGEQRREMIAQKEQQKQSWEYLKEESKNQKNMTVTDKSQTQIIEQRRMFKEIENQEREMDMQRDKLKCKVESFKDSRKKEEELTKKERTEGERFQAWTELQKNRVRVVKEKCDANRDEGVNNLNDIYSNTDADFVWRIDQCLQKRWTKIFSESFDSNDYKLCLSADIGGDDIILRCHILRGDNDDRVEWPMRLSVTLGIVNQDTLMTHTSHTTQYDTYQYNQSAFDRPKTERNGPICVGSSIKYSTIKDDKSIIFGDSVIVSCVLNDSRQSLSCALVPEM